MFACNGILFNHESPRRGETFVTRKITRGLARIDAGLDNLIFVGNLDSLRDWGHAKDFVEMQWLMLQQDEPEDYVIATGKQISVRQFISIASEAIGWGGILWEGRGLDEIGRRKDNGRVVIKVDSRYFRPTEVDNLLGNSEKAKKKLGWEPKTNIKQLIYEMIQNDVKETKTIV